MWAGAVLEGFLEEVGYELESLGPLVAIDS